MIDHPIRKRDDYPVLIYMAQDACPTPIDDEVRLQRQAFGEDGYVIGSLGQYSPLMDIQVNLAGVDGFAYEMADNADLFWSLYEALCAKMRRAYPQFLAEALRVIQASEFELELGQADRPGLIKSGANFLYVLMPINLG
jgi:hypothetical protein